MENNLENLTIGVFAKAAGVNVETIRFYQRKGLLREPDLLWFSKNIPKLSRFVPKPQQDN